MRPAAGLAALGVGPVLLLLWCPRGRTEVRSQRSGLGAQSKNGVPGMQWLSDAQTREKAPLRQHSHAPWEHHGP